MSKNKKLTPSEMDHVQYRRAPGWMIAMAQLNAGVGMCFYILLGYASYVANVGYGVATAVVGLILTGTRIFDGITDPLIALIIDKLNTRFGKIRILLVSGWLIESLAVLILFDWASGKGQGMLTFILIYMLYVIGYTLNNVTAQIIGPVMTNDPKQRPLVGVWSTIFNYLVPMIFSMVITMVILPKYGNQYTVEMLAESSHLCILISAVFLLACCIGVTPVDKPETFAKIQVKGGKSKVRLKDMWELLKSNRALQMFIVSASSDKLATQTASQSIVATMLFGIVIGNMQLSAVLSMIGMLPSILFAIVGARYCGKHGNKEAMVTWTRVCIIVAALSVVFFVVIDPRQIASKIPMMVIFVVLTLAMNGAKMCVTTSNGAMMADITDYEMNRSGNFLPASVSATYSFLDKLISSLGATIATACVALIGYTNTLPQPTDTCTSGIFWMALGIYYGLPVIGWICTLIAMKFSPLSRETMVEVQQSIAEKKAAAAAAD